MTDIVALSRSLFNQIEWQRVPDTFNVNDLANMIADAIKWLYVMTGRSSRFSGDMFERNEDGLLVSFSENLPLDEEQYVLLTAHINFLRKVQTDVDDMSSYSTDAMAISHGDKPYANLQQTITDLRAQQNMVWHKMIRYHLL